MGVEEAIQENYGEVPGRLIDQGDRQQPLLKRRNSRIELVREPDPVCFAILSMPSTEPSGDAAATQADISLRRISALDHFRSGPVSGTRPRPFGDPAPCAACKQYQTQCRSCRLTGPY